MNSRRTKKMSAPREWRMRVRVSRDFDIVVLGSTRKEAFEAFTELVWEEEEHVGTTLYEAVTQPRTR